jgi:threonine aldolase
MLSFENDYIEGAHERILQRLLETNMEKTSGYGSDPYCESAREKIRKVCDCPQAEIFFLTGGTQTNQIVIDTMLKPWEGVVAACTGHVSSHEAGAIEHGGHKVLELPQHDGRIEAEELKAYLEIFWEDENHEHMVFPGMVYISHPTEYGTLYSKSELEELSSVCGQYGIPLYLDGARLGYGLMSRSTDVTLPDIARLTDVFYIGGTKVGALCGEAVVFTKQNMPKHFLTMVKQHGALLAKGRLLGIQFDTLFTDDLYFSISRHAIDMAELLKEGLRGKGYPFFLESPTNQQFVILENNRMKELEKQVKFSFWEKADENHTVVRFATSWATKREDLQALLELL